MSYLELYAFARERGVELPWIFMAHLVSRNAGYLMTDLGAALDDPSNVFTRESTEELFALLERANFLIFHDAWFHVLHHLLGRTGELGDETPRFIRERWRAYEEAAAAGVSPELERSLVMDLVTNEQNLIEHRVVHHPRFPRARAMIAFFEGVGREAPIVLPETDARITVGAFARIERRVEAVRRIFDEVLAERATRERLFRWAMEHPHTGSRVVYTSRPRHDQTLRAAWPTARVRELFAFIHEPPEKDPRWP